MAAGPKDRWDKVSIFLQPIGGLMTAGAIAVFGFATSAKLGDRQALETNARLYSELMSKREESESALRKDMFVSIINSFLHQGGSDLASDVLNLELLAYNFHESLNLKPLFIDLKRRVRAAAAAAPSDAARREAVDFEDRLERVAGEIARKQMVVLEGVGKRVDRTIELNDEVEGSSLEPATLSLDEVPTTFVIDIVEVDREDREIQMALQIETPDPQLGRQTKTASFTVSHFDFPMIDNTRLVHGQRCAVVLNSFTDEAADVTLVLFPGAYASLKEKPYYSEVLESVRRANAQSLGEPAPAPSTAR